MKKHTTKRALLSSALSLLLCVAMLIGTTFAWFTDSVTSASNVIKSGNLDIDVEYTLDGENWDDLNGADDLFQKGLWEPGHTEVVLLKITNKGSLALKYTANMNIVGEQVGKTKDGADIVLSDILTVSTCTQQYTDGNGNVASGADIFPAMTFNGEGGVDGWIGYQTTSTFKAGNVLKSDKQLQPKESDYIAVKVDMAETVGNEANHDGVNVPSIEFGINVNATQYTYEKDSFDNQYDKDATYDTEIPLAKTKAFKANDIVKLTKDDGSEVTILGEGMKIDTNGNSSWGEKLGEINLDTAYQFLPTMSKAEAEENDYADWHADFVVSANKAVPEDSIALAGYYDAWCQYNSDKWVAFTNKGLPVGAGEEVRLVGGMGLNVSYKEICEYGNDGIGFLCGAKAIGKNKLEPGTVLTVELRLYETLSKEESSNNSANEETGKYITVGKYYYTFK